MDVVNSWVINSLVGFKNKCVGCGKTKEELSIACIV